MAFFPGVEGSSVIAVLHTFSIVLLVFVIAITVIKTLPRMISGRKSKSRGMVGKRIDRSFAKTESKIKRS
ncbi:hypothetical protein GPK93_11g21700 [Encephalitozoon intestinalis]|nr:hypothetical protein GPK93_11g21700 [Encephalitozoon intestinalis]